MPNSQEERTAYDAWLARQDDPHREQERADHYRALSTDLPKRPGTRR
jgi:hypothetical protein